MVFPISLRSTRIQLDPLIEGLLKQGHEVTGVFSFPSNISHVNYHEKVIPDSAVEVYERFSGKVFMNEAGPDLGSLKTFRNMLQEDLNGVQFDYESLHVYDELEVLIKDKSMKIDTLMVNAYTGIAFYYLAQVFECPIIVFSPEGPLAGLLGNMGNPDNPSWQISNYSPFVEPMSFFQRLYNVWNRILLLGFQRLHFMLLKRELTAKFKSEIPDLGYMERNVSLMLSNSHHLTHGPAPSSPNTIEAAGLHLRPGRKLPPNLENILDSASDGAVYVSFGSTVKPSMMPDEKLNLFLEAFREIQVPIIWKWDTKQEIPNLPSNVHLTDWAPQQDLLAHRNLAVFLTHGGLLSLQEAMYHSVPVVGIPIWFDQRPNLMRAAKHGYAIHLEWDTITKEMLSAALNKAMFDKEMKRKVEKITKLFHDQKENPVEKAVWWIEYVMRHGGAEFLRPHSLDLYWFQYICLDIVGFLVAIILLACVAISKFWNSYHSRRLKKKQ